MKPLIIITHPNLNTSTVNQYWRDKLNQHTDQLDIHELYTTYPDANIDIDYEQKLLMEHDYIIFQFPFYWYSYPPLLKQYFDQVFTYGWAYGSEGNALKGKTFAAAVSVGAQAAQYAEDGPLGYTFETLISPFISTARFVGAQFGGYHTLYGALNPSQETLEENAQQYLHFIQSLKSQ
ncbi:NAD(P)H-dependent oxidoreductase [Staphylococcus pettenkoferi]|uniref:NAD(P)H-dependent oxidoreductase n=1 Tax=Staphylococcus pettenkoferi TaxID=170573 RepID=UPI00066D8D45|nr:NAD(P)H-dependent oxidoreductase [Staphylococcus pettenkoferi]MCI2802649.1 NAD(P)H-dependent oxidoreductase [Staphylococcus pettenkoferi]MCY1574220.1 NAD(P)H-dependent oxidoreductase [Staphylococcus pettenkoferi]MCY1577629.1 NAD(P)H-dependent oxidoreductase [Staphylococcus pettenkoferi]MCY1585072.1 NAD(P)H-dependent oxidoreductase [Staphylococcus pettenkoferi]MCY1626636.1 NAD(P)H-dependent oxidoreductase [Staphylococcus pettenkoferi]